MILSERGAINAAIADGRYCLYPAGKLFAFIKTELGDDLKADFNPASLIDKLSNIKGPTDGSAMELFQKDLHLLKSRLEKMSPEYDIETVFDKMISAVQAMAKRYYGIDNFEAPRPKVVEYYFEGSADLYKNADWFAFNVNHAESKELGVPVGIYFKRNQVSPGIPEFVAFHEANHAMQEITSLPEGMHFYVPWIDEGLSDVLGRMMLYRATGSEDIIEKVKRFRTEVEVIDPRKATYHYDDEIAALLLFRGRLPFMKALLKERKNDPLAIDWNELGVKIRAGWDPHLAAVTACKKGRQDSFRKRMEREEAKFRKDADLDQSDLKILSMFLCVTQPACLSAEEYSAALWFGDEVAKIPSPYSVDSNAIPENLRASVPEWREDALLPASQIPKAVWDKVPELMLKIQIPEETVPSHLKVGAEKIASNYFVVRRKFGETISYEPYGGGLPYRLGVGELRCSY